MQTFVFSFPGLTVKMCSFIRALASWTQLKEPKTVFHDLMQLFVKLTECLLLCFSCETEKKKRERKKERNAVFWKRSILPFSLLSVKARLFQ